jgi:hypothetical protein
VVVELHLSPITPPFAAGYIGYDNITKEFLKWMSSDIEIIALG